jgi:hypothetical protein
MSQFPEDIDCEPAICGPVSKPLLMNMMHTPGGREFWRERSYVFAPDFRDEVEDMIGRDPHPGANAFGVLPTMRSHLRETSHGSTASRPCSDLA